MGDGVNGGEGGFSEAVRGRPMSRLKLLKAGAALGVGGVAGGLLPAAADAKPEAEPPALKFLNGWEFDYITRWLRRSGRPTTSGRAPRRRCRLLHRRSARRQLGQGHRFYLNGPFFQPQTTGTAGRSR